MREVAFLKRNEKKWKDLEDGLEKRNKFTPDELSDRYIQLTDDYAYSKTFYPDSKVNQYLNQLLSLTHSRIYRNKKENRSRIIKFWITELPNVIYEQRRFLLYSFIIFGLSVLIGAYSSSQDKDYVRLILGDHYVNRTIENIENGEPMAIYKGGGELNMFLGITFNNVRVSFIAFAYGVLFSLGTVIILVLNGIMLGSFQYFFYEYGYLLESVLSIWVHGTLEISAIIIAGGAGILFGASFMFPGTYSRKYAFQKAAKDGIKIIFGLIPIFIIAGFLEGFVTRHADVVPFVAASIISVSVIFILYYFIYYPISLNNNQPDGTNKL